MITDQEMEVTLGISCFKSFSTKLFLKLAKYGFKTPKNMIEMEVRYQVFLGKKSF